MENPFKFGDIVQLKSGGPAMTYEYYGQRDEYLHCKWFDGSELKKSDFYFEALKKYEAPKNEKTSNPPTQQFWER